MKKTHLVALILSFALIAPVFALADQSTDALIAKLKQQIAELTAQLTALQKIQNEGQTWCHTFNANLKVGDSGPEVSALKTALEREGFNLGSADDAISPPGTRAYFAEYVAAAVTGFQEKYRSEILAPLGLKYGTGYVGKATRAKLNQLYGCGGGNSRIGSLYIKPAITSLRVGESVELQAMYQPPMPPCPEGMMCIASMPAPVPVIAKWSSSNPSVATISTIVGDCFTAGCVPIYVFSASGISNGVAAIKAIYTTPSGAMLTATTNVTVTNAATISPQITSISPQSGPVGTKVTLTGTGFALTAYAMCIPPECPPAVGNNMVRFGPTTISNVKSDDGKTLSFQVPADFQPSCRNNQCPTIAGLITPGVYYISLMNAKGTSNNVSFTVTGAATKSSIQILSPNGGELRQIGSMQTIRWSYSAGAIPAGYTMAISLVDGPTPGLLQYLETIPSGNTYQLKIPNYAIQGDVAMNLLPGKYKLDIYLYDGPQCLGLCPLSGSVPRANVVAHDQSDAPFSIVSRP